MSAIESYFKKFREWHILGVAQPLFEVGSSAHCSTTGVLEGHDLGGGFFAGLFLKEHVVCRIGIERRVEVNQINAGVSNIFAEILQIVAKIELILAIHDRESITQSWSTL